MNCDDCSDTITVEREMKIRKQEFDDTGIVEGSLVVVTNLVCGCSKVTVDDKGYGMYDWPEGWSEGIISGKPP